jgi:hypothetical protein
MPQYIKHAYSIPELAGDPLGKSSIYNAIRDGRLRAVKFGRRNFILNGDSESFLAGLPAIPHPYRSLQCRSPRPDAGRAVDRARFRHLRFLVSGSPHPPTPNRMGPPRPPLCQRATGPIMDSLTAPLRIDEKTASAANQPPRRYSMPGLGIHDGYVPTGRDQTGGAR